MTYVKAEFMTVCKWYSYTMTSNGTRLHGFSNSAIMHIRTLLIPIVNNHKVEKSMILQ